MFFGAMLSYVGEIEVLSWSGYLIALFAVVSLFGLWKIPSAIRIALAAAGCVAALLVTVVSMVRSPYAGAWAETIQSLAYPLVGFALLLVGWRFRCSRPTAVARFLVGVGALNFTVSLLAATGVISSIPLIGPIETGRVVFGTDLRSSAGLFFNVNYYATVQAVIFMLHGWALSLQHRPVTPVQLFVSAMLALSTLMGSSRGVTAGLLVVFLLLALLRLPTMSGRKKLAIAFAGVVVAGIIAFVVVQNWDWVYTAFRVGKGLNYRDIVWGAGIEVWADRPWLGWGYMAAASERLGSMIGHGGSLQSAYLQTLIRGGVLLTVATYGLVLAVVFYGLGFRKDLWVRYRWPLALVVFWLVNSFVRTYSFGGLGLMPVTAGIALSALLYARWVPVRAQGNDERASASK